MNILGMGTIEVLVVLVVAFIVLGPERMVDAARLLGKASRELRRMAEELPDLTLDAADPPDPAGGPSLAQARAPRAGASDAPGQDEPAPGDEGPVEFRPSPAPETRGGDEESSGER